MKVQIKKVSWYSWEYKKGLHIEFTNSIVALVEDTEVAIQLSRLLCENTNLVNSVFEVELMLENIDVIILKNIVLIG